MNVDADGWFCNYCNGMADHLSSAHPGSKCTPERCTEADKPMIQRAHTPRTCPATIHECDTGHFDRSICPEPCGTMHSYCRTCGERQDNCAHEPN